MQIVKIRHWKAEGSKQLSSTRLAGQKGSDQVVREELGFCIGSVMSKGLCYHLLSSAFRQGISVSQIVDLDIFHVITVVHVDVASDIPPGVRLVASLRSRRRIAGF